MLMSAAFLLSALLQFALALVVAALLGPQDFGLYALALSGAILTQTLLLEWLRLCAARFHHVEAGRALPRLLWRLTFGLGAMLLAAGLVAWALLPRHGLLYALVPVVALVSAAADLALALLRAEFAGARFARFMLARNALGIFMVPLAAYMLKTPEAALAATALATLLPTLALALAHRTALPPAGAAQAPTMAHLLGYAGPIVLTNGLYQGGFFALRAGVALVGGLATAGQFSLALDFVLKLFSTAGTALDLALFPLALKAERAAGMEKAEAQARANLEIILAVLAPMALGLALVAPGLEPLLVAPAFRGFFAGFVMALSPGIALYALVQYGLHPFSQLRHETGVLAVAAAMALLAGGGIALLAPPGTALDLMFAWLLAGAMLAAALILLGHTGHMALPSARFAASLLACLALLGVVVAPFAVSGFTVPLLVAAVLLGTLAYAGGALALDLAGIRTLLDARRDKAHKARQ